MPELHNFLKQHPNKKEKFEAMLDLALGASKYKLFIKRKLQNLAEAGTSASTPISEWMNLEFTKCFVLILSEGAPVGSKQTDSIAAEESASTVQRNSGPRQSLLPQQPAVQQPVIPADADDDTKLAMYKDKLKYYALGSASGDSVSSG